MEKKLGKNPQPPFGQGNIRGVAGPESANNAGAQTSFIPLLTLGIPPNAVMALMVGAMTIHNIQPGPQVMTSNPALFWGMIASMWIGNLMLVILNLPLIGMWVQLLKVPYRMLYPAILMFCCIGVFSVNNNSFDVLITVIFGVLGIIFIKVGAEPAPLLLGFILGPMMEENFRRAMLLSRGDPTVFFTRPLSLTMLIMAAALLAIIAMPQIAKKREETFGGRRNSGNANQRYRQSHAIRRGAMCAPFFFVGSENLQQSPVGGSRKPASTRTRTKTRQARAGR